jgi:hypothetical protein
MILNIRQVMKAKILALVVFGALAAVANAQVDVKWNFGVGGGSGIPSTIPPNVTGGVIAWNNPYSGDVPTFAADGVHPSTGYPGASGVHDGQIATVNGALDMINSTHFDFTLTPSASYQLDATSFQLGSYSETAVGPQTLTLFSSLDGFTAPLWTASVTANGTWALVTGTFNSNNPLIAPLNTAVTFRLYASDGVGGSALTDWRIDDVDLGVIAVPEPSTYASLLVGVVVLGARALRRRKSAVA